jgi:hypothetical protein
MTRDNNGRNSEREDEDEYLALGFSSTLREKEFSCHIRNGHDRLSTTLIERGCTHSGFVFQIGILNESSWVLLLEY